MFLIYLLWIPLFIFSCKDTDRYSISADISGLESSDVYIIQNPYNADAYSQIDTLTAENGKFTYKGTAENHKPILIYLNSGDAWITVWAKNGDRIHVKGKATYPEMISIHGNEINDKLSDFKKENGPTLKERGDLRDRYIGSSRNQSNLTTEVAESQLLSQILNLDLALRNKAEGFVKSHPASIASLVLIQDFIIDSENPHLVGESLELISGEARNNPLFALLSDIQKEKRIETGQEAPDFTAISMTKDSLSLDTYKDKLLLFSFMASWADSVSHHLTQLEGINKQYGKKELVLLTISLDENDDDWKKLIESRNVKWDQVIDTKGWSSSFVDLYNVYQLPAFFLIAPDGIILESKESLDHIKAQLDIIYNEQPLTDNS